MIRRLSLTTTMMQMIVVRFRTRCTTAFGLCAVNEKQRIAHTGAQIKLVWIQGQLQVDMVDVTTCKFVGDASLNNDSFIQGVIYWLANINNWANLQLPLDTQKQKGIQLQGGKAGGSAPDPRYRLALRARHRIRTTCSSKLILKKAVVKNWRTAAVVYHLKS